MSGSPPVTFNYTAWVTRYPEFASVPGNLAQLYFNEATLYCENCLRVVTSVTALTQFLNMLTAHIAALNSPTTPSGASPGTPPGRISSATEGSVTSQFEMDYPPGSAQWFNQTKYGAAFWQAAKAYRLFQFRPYCPGPASLAQVPWLYSNTGS